MAQQSVTLLTQCTARGMDLDRISRRRREGGSHRRSLARNYDAHEQDCVQKSYLLAFAFAGHDYSSGHRNMHLIASRPSSPSRLPGAALENRRLLIRPPQARASSESTESDSCACCWRCIPPGGRTVSKVISVAARGRCRTRLGLTSSFVRYSCPPKVQAAQSRGADQADEVILVAT